MNSSRGTSRMARAMTGERTPRSSIWCATICRRASLKSAMAWNSQVSCPMDAAAILDDFAARGRRYLWTDAFAVMTWVGLYETSGERRFLALAQDLVSKVHGTLGA